MKKGLFDDDEIINAADEPKKQTSDDEGYKELFKILTGTETETEEKSCDKTKRCLKEVNPASFPGVYFGTPHIYDPDWLGCVFCKEEEKKEPYLSEEVCHVEKCYNPNYGDERLCKCGHSYYRHFDTYENMAPVGCKYCRCYEFEEEEDKTATDE